MRHFSPGEVISCLEDEIFLAANVTFQTANVTFLATNVTSRSANITFDTQNVMFAARNVIFQMRKHPSPMERDTCCTETEPFRCEEAGASVAGYALRSGRAAVAMTYPDFSP
jgi:hypothetical protein